MKTPIDVSKLTTEDIVRAAYRSFLGREAESAEVVTRTAEAFQTIEELLVHFISSSEHAKRQGRSDFYQALRAGLAAPQSKIDVHVNQQEITELFERVRDQWRRLGETDPYWSVLTNEKFRLSQIDKNRREFELSGRHAVELFDRAVLRSGVSVPRGTLVELGCGVGRVTRFLAPKAEQVIALDVSEGNLRICGTYIETAGVSNVEARLVSRPDDLENLPYYDILFTVIVLQHNPPPIMKYMLEVLLSKIKRGGVAYFQLPTSTPGYAFDCVTYLASNVEVLDMHVLPMPEVLAIIRRAGMELQEVVMDTWTGMYGSHTFLATKP